MTAPRQSFAAGAAAVWDGSPPDWIVALAEEVDRSSQTAVARRIGYSASVVSQTLRRTYSGDLATLEHAVRGAFLGAVVTCPVLDDIARDQCLEEQRLSSLAGAATSGLRMQLARACKTCPHSRNRGDK